MSFEGLVLVLHRIRCILPKELGSYILGNEWMSQWCCLDLLSLLRLRFVPVLYSVYFCDLYPIKCKNRNFYSYDGNTQAHSCASQLQKLSETIPNWLVAWVLKIWSCQAQWIICIHRVVTASVERARINICGSRLDKILSNSKSPLF